MSKINRIFNKYLYITKSRVRSIIKKCVKLISTIGFDYSQSISVTDYYLLPHPVNWRKLFPYKNLYVEIGTGHGEMIEFLSKRTKEDLYVGFEITKKYSQKTARRIADIKNGYVFCTEAYSAILNLFSKNSISGVYVLFPDPWHKKRHHKRRPLTAEWLEKIGKKISAGGFILFATDWEEYYDYVLEQFKVVDEIYTIEVGAYLPKELGLTETHYYLKWLKQGKDFRYIRAIKRAI